ncbi:oligosaccharide flippase family protein [Vibrio cholerae]|uniref:oligosaccharide flippase family protein n=1 Tax=Vibrio cholerae TaxID=666 RepID=UPI000E0ABEF3|nr:oligosaccharide flippase family protein [Vibrio cholerae]
MIRFKNKYLKSGLWVLIEKVTKILTTLAITSILARTVSVEEFGVYSYYLAIFAITTLLVSFGSEQLVIKDSSKGIECTLESFFIIRLISSVITCIFLILFLYLFKLDYYYTLAIALVSICQSFMVMTSYYQGIVNYKGISILSSFSLLISLLIKIFLVAEYQERYLSVVMIFDFLLISFILALFLSKHIKIINNTSSLKLSIVRNFKRSFPLLISALGIVIYSRIDQFMIYKMLGSEQLALYSSVVRIGDVFAFIPAVAINAFIPYYEKKKNEGSDVILKFFKYVVIYAIIVIFIINFFSSTIISILYGDKYMSSTDILRFYSLAIFFSYIGAASNVWLIAHELQKYKTYRILGGCIINVFLNFLWIPSYGIQGAVFATIISQCFASWILNVVSKKTKPLFILQNKAFIIYRWKN